MPRSILLLLFAVCIVAAGSARAQVTADQLNKLTLEALTAPPVSRYRPASHHGYAAPAGWRGSYLGSRSRGSYASRGYHAQGRPRYAIAGHGTAAHRTHPAYASSQSFLYTGARRSYGPAPGRYTTAHGGYGASASPLSSRAMAHR